MPDDQISRMALWAAYFRAFHAQEASPKVFDDFLAARLIEGLVTDRLAQTRGFARMLAMNAEERARLEPRIQRAISALDTVGPPHLRPFADTDAAFDWIIRTMVPSSLVLSRSRYTEDLLDEAIGQGVYQYVILGAGLDTFALRRPELLRRIEVFEVDDPATQAGKRRRIAELGWAEPPGLHFVPIDFAKESLGAALMRGSFEPKLPTFFGWLGVTYYLERAALLQTMHSIAELAAPGRALVFDYLEADAFVREKQALRVHFTLAEGDRVGEPLRSGLDPATLPATLAGVGLRLHEDLGPPEIQRRYFAGRRDGYYAFEQAHVACALTGS